MRAPTQIKFQGQLYVLAATQHKKCPKGQHWNDAERKCMKLPLDIALASSRAFKLSAEADALHDAVPSRANRWNHHKLVAHHRAAKAHEHADAAAYDNGFNTLALEHSKRQEAHDAVIKSMTHYHPDRD